MKKNAIIGMMALTVMGLSGCGKQEISLVSDQIEIELGSALDEAVINYVELDAEEAAQAVVDFSAVDVMAAGTYTANVTYHKQQIPFEVVVKDTTAPKYRINNPIVVELGEPIYAEDVIDAITELSGKVTVSFEEPEETEETVAEGTETINGKMEDNAEDSVVLDGVTFNNAVVTYTEIGTYEIKMTVMDASGNSDDVFVPIIVGTSPVFEEIEDITVTEGAGAVFYTRGVKAKDCFGNDISHLVICHAEGVDLNKAGIYTVTFIVTDTYGFKAEKSATVIVKEQEWQQAGSSKKSSGSRNEIPEATGTGKTTGTSTTSNTSSGSTGSNANSDSGKSGSGNSSSGNSSSGGQSVNPTPSKPDAGNSGKENGNNGGQTPAPTPAPSPTPDKGDSSSNNGGQTPAPTPTPDTGNGNGGTPDSNGGMAVPDGAIDMPVFDPSTNPPRDDEIGGGEWTVN